jgi:hypothetical protein
VSHLCNIAVDRSVLSQESSVREGPPCGRSVTAEILIMRPAESTNQLSMRAVGRLSTANPSELLNHVTVIRQPGRGAKQTFDKVSSLNGPSIR